MAFLRPMGVFLLTGTALHSQTRTAQHVARMKELAAASASLALVADAELSDATALRAKSALDAEAGLSLQSESAALEAAAEREFAMAAAATALGDGYLEEAEALHEASARDALESEALIADAEEMHLQSEQFRAQAAKDRAAAAWDEEKSIVLLEEAARDEEMAAAAEEQAAGYQAIALRRETQSAKDAGDFLATETEALEDAEVVAACTPIPFLDIICDAVGAIVESGYEAIAAYEGAKAAVESMGAALAHRKERAQLIIAIEEEEEAARNTVEAEKFQALAGEESGRAAVEEAEGEAAEAEAGREQLLGEEKMSASEKEEALATLDEEKATEEYAEAARDESIALEEESSAIATQLESEELLEESTGEEFESLNEQLDGESKEANAAKMMKESVGHGIHALGFSLYAVGTAGLVVYVIVVKNLSKSVAHGVARDLSGEHTLARGLSVERTRSHLGVVERLCRFILHAGVIVATIASMPNLLSIENTTAPRRARALLTLALVAGITESLCIHSTLAACQCHVQRAGFGHSLTSAAWAFFSNFIHLVPVTLMELLIITTIFGPGVFSETHVAINPVLMWCTLFFLVYIFIRNLVLRSMETKSSSGTSSFEDGEHNPSYRSVERNVFPPSEIWDEHHSMLSTSSMEEVSLLSSTTSGYGSSDHQTILESKSTCKKDANLSTSVQKCGVAFHQYWERLRPTCDLLVLSVVAMLLWRCSPTLKILYPVATTSLGTVASWVSLPIMLTAVTIAAVIVHFLFVR